MNEIIEELDPPPNQSPLDISGSAKKALAVFAVLLIIALYVANLFFGQNSVPALWRLTEQRDHLKQEIERIKSQNAMYQKELFELEKLEGKK